ncbi:MAG: ABC transporter permease [Kiritimatiellia bacterium]|jgi:phospholipid/cholesterol/gamma-HCH transport system permease protein
MTGRVPSSNNSVNVTITKPNFLHRIGARFNSRLAGANYLAATAGTLLWMVWQPRRWPRTTRNVFARQLLFTGVEALKFVALAALMVGISVVVQAQLWLGKAGQADLLGKILVMVIIRELGPLLVNFIIIGRSGNAIATELAGMKINGEIQVLESQGIDPLLYLAMPRALAMAVAVLCLTVWFIVISLTSGYICGILVGVGAGDPLIFLDSVLKGLRPADVFNLLFKTLLPGMTTGLICVMEGLSVKTALTEVPQAATRAVVASIGALFVISAIISVITYL